MIFLNIVDLLVHFGYWGSSYPTRPPPLCVRAWYSASTVIDVMFLLLKTENGKITRQEYKQRYFYYFQDDDKAGSSNRSSSRAHGRSSQPNDTKVSIIIILS